jgi:putative restriction endonuclease
MARVPLRGPPVTGVWRGFLWLSECLIGSPRGCFSAHKKWTCEGRHRPFDRIVFRRPRADGGNLAYFACALVSALEPDPDSPSMTFAHLGDFMQFDDPVPWTIQGRYWEEDLRNIPQQQVGVNLRGRSVRPLSEDDFASIVAAGLSETLAAQNAERLNLSLATVAQANADLHAPPGQDRERRVERVLTNRAIRDASFRRLVCDAYEGRCAVTRLRILDAETTRRCKRRTFGRLQTEDPT